MGRHRWRLGRHRRLNLALVVVVGACALASGGCAHFIAYYFADRHPKKKVKAEYHLEAERLVIVPYAGMDILFTYPAANLEVSLEIVNEIMRRLDGRVKSITHPVQVVQWQESTLDWPNMDLGEIARAFEADTVLYIEMERYTTVEERSANLLRGRVKARLQVAKADAERNPVFETVVETIWPPDRPVGVLETSERRVRQYTNILFAEAVLRKFYDHEVEIKGVGP